MLKRIKKLDTGYYCICSVNSINAIESKVNEIIDRLNGGDCIHEVTTLSQDCCNSKPIDEKYPTGNATKAQLAKETGIDINKLKRGLKTLEEVKKDEKI